MCVVVTSSRYVPLCDRDDSLHLRVRQCDQQGTGGVSGAAGSVRLCEVLLLDLDRHTNRGVLCWSR